MDFRRLFDILPYQQAKYPQDIALAHKQELDWVCYSTSRFAAMIDQVSAGLLDLGLNRGDKAAIMTPNGCPEWCFLDLGMMQIGVVVVPIHASASPQDIQLILNETEVKYCFAADRELFEAIRRIKPFPPKLLEVFTIAPLPDIRSFQQILTAPTPKHYETFQSLRASIHEDDLATIIYTSGTQGEPKGVMLSHKNIVSNVKALLTLAPVNCDKRVLSFLPLSHIFERTILYTYLAAGASVYFAGARTNLLEKMHEVRPHYCAAVPRLLEKMYDLLVEKANERSWLVRRLIFWSIQLGERYPGRRKMSPAYWLQLSLADVLVFRRWRRLTGGRLEGIVVGSAALQPRLSRLFSAAGVEVREGYGLTETAPVVSFNRFEPGGVRFGTVGLPLPGVAVKIEDPDENGQGEILVKGPNVMLGYYKREQETLEQFTADGWFRTGDVGRMEHKRFLQITDRKKNIFKTSSGKYVAPQLLENLLKSSGFIEQCMIVGNNRSFVAALLVPSFPSLQRWCDENNVHWTAPQYMVLNLKVIQLLEQEIEQLNRSLPPHQKIRKFHLLFEEWSEATGELTLTLKTKRRVLMEKYQKEIDLMYQ
jgi:long-chain acyl-CoA synthetase